MYTLARLSSYVSRGIYTVSGPFHPFGGAVDIIVVQQPDGSFKSSPWYVKFGKFQGVLKTKEKIVKICVNGVEADFHMWLDHKGEAYFVSEEVEDLVDSPPSSGDESDKQSQIVTSKSGDFGSTREISVAQSEMGSGEIVSRTNSRRSRLLGLVFGQGSKGGGSERGGIGVESVSSMESADIVEELLDRNWSTSPPREEQGRSNASRLPESNIPFEKSEIDSRVCGSSFGSDPVLDAATGPCDAFPIQAGEPDASLDVTVEGSISKSKLTDLKNFNLVEPGVTPSSHSDTEHDCNVRNGLIVSGVHEVEDKKEIISSHADCETSESSNLNDVGLLSCEKSREVVSNEAIGGRFMDSVQKLIELESDSLGDICKGTSNVTEAKRLQVIQPENVEEDQFLFSDIGHLESNRFETDGSVSPRFMDTKAHPLASLVGIEDEQEPKRGSSLSSDNLDDEYPLLTFEKVLIEESNSKSTPLSISRSQMGPAKECKWMAESLPNMRSHIENLEIPDVLHVLSCSVDSSSKSLRWPLFEMKDSNSSESGLGFDHDANKEQLTASDSRNSEELKTMPSSAEVDISLSEQLLYEGNRAHAPSQAFGAENTDLEKFVSLSPRIGSCDPEQNYEAEGMVAVNGVEETLDGISPRAIVASGGSWGLWPFSFKRSRAMESVHSGLEDIKSSGSANEVKSSRPLSENINMRRDSLTKRDSKRIVPTTEQLESLNLKEGPNLITFIFSTAMLGKQQVDARIYLWKWNARVVISDVDGTITKSDVLGQFMPMVGRDWSQTGVAHLFSAIEDNGYQLLFLSARAISQAYLTRQFLLNLKQDGKALPDGPVVISPDGLFPSLFREVIRRAPHEFKIACLKDIKALFPPDCNPFYAGFGNRDTDEISYLKVGIPKGKIFTVNPKGQVAVNRRVDLKSYTSIHALVNGMFPAMSSIGQEEFNSYNYWKLPLPDIDD